MPSTFINQIEVESGIDVIKAAVALSEYKKDEIVPIFSSSIDDNKLLLVVDPIPLNVDSIQIVNIYYCTLADKSLKKMARYYISEEGEIGEFLECEKNPLGFYVPIINIDKESYLVELIRDEMKSEKSLQTEDLVKLINFTEVESINDLITLMRMLEIKHKIIYLKSTSRKNVAFIVNNNEKSSNYTIDLFFYKTKENIFSSIFGDNKASNIALRIIRIKESKVFNKILRFISG